MYVFVYIYTQVYITKKVIYSFSICLLSAYSKTVFHLQGIYIDEQNNEVFLQRAYGLAG